MTLEKSPTAALLVLLLVLGWSAPGRADPLVNERAIVETFTREEIERMPARNVSDLINLIPGVDLGGATDGGADPASLRGLSRGPSQFLVNGVRSPDYDRTTPIDDVERIEILRVGVGYLYGREANSGVINVITKQDHQPTPIDGSRTFNDFFNPLSRISVSMDYSGECDSTNGVTLPFQLIFPKFDWGGPTSIDGGKKWLYGSQSDGYPPLGSATPPPSVSESTSGDESQADWRMQFNVSHKWRVGDGSFQKKSAEGVYINLLEYKWSEEFSLPLDGAFRNIELGASDSSQRNTTGADGRATFYLGLFKKSLGLHWVPPSVWTQATSTPTSEDAGAVESYELGTKSQFGVNWDTRTLAADISLAKIESILQRVYRGDNSPDLQYGEYVTDRFSFGGFDFLVHDIPAWVNFDRRQLEATPGHVSSENNACGHSALPPNGLGYLSQASSPVQSVEDQWALEHVGMTDGLTVSDASSGEAEPIVVGVIDTGLDWNHLDFAWENIWRNEDEIPDNGIDDDENGFVDDIIGWNFVNKDNKPWDQDGHGTFVSGIIAATHNNGAGIDGINPNAKVMVLKALNNFGRTRASYVAQAIVYGADNGARILNLSVSGSEVPSVVIDALAYARAKGVLVVTAAGNGGEDVDRGEPAGVPGLMFVAATGPDDRRAVFSNVGSSINIAAPGVDIVSLRARQTDFMLNSPTTTYQPGDAYLGEDKRYYRSAGTSFATPIVSGVASLVWSQRPELTVTQVQRILEQSARDVETPGRDRFTGYGVVDAQAALGADPEFFVDAAILLTQRVEEDGQVFVQVFGTADASEFGRAWLEIGEGEDPSLWIPVGDVLTAGIRLDELGRIPAGQLDGAKVWTVRVISEHQNGRQQEARYVIELG